MSIGIEAHSRPQMELLSFSHVAGKIVGSLYCSKKYQSPTAMLSLQGSGQEGSIAAISSLSSYDKVSGYMNLWVMNYF